MFRSLSKECVPLSPLRRRVNRDGLLYALNYLPLVDHTARGMRRRVRSKSSGFIRAAKSGKRDAFLTLGT